MAFVQPTIDAITNFSFTEFYAKQNDFVWDKDALPLAKDHWLVTAPLMYLAGVGILKSITPEGGIPLGPLPILHNVVLVLWSLAMFVGMAYETVLLTEKMGSAEWIFCVPPGTKAEGRLYFWSYIYYLSKYYEFIDTVIIIVKRKDNKAEQQNQQLTFLHVYHHAAVVIMSWLWLESAQSLQSIALLTNTGVHIVMYTYYFLRSIGIKPAWKKMVTNGQIFQFMLSLVACVPFLVLHYQKGCGGFRSWAFNASFSVSLLFLFLDFSRRTYRGNKKGKGEGAASKKKR